MKETWINTGNGRLYTKIWGEQNPVWLETAPIVLFHDSLGCVDLWRDFPGRLSRATGRTVIAYDRLGCGRSDPYPGDLSRDFIREEALGSFRVLRDQLEFESFVAFGHSVGGGMAVICAATFPGYCRALVTEAAQAFVEDRTLEGIRQAKRAFEREGELGRLEKYHGDKARWVLGSWTDTWLAPEFSRWTLDDDLPQVKCPVLVIHGEDDEYGTIRHPQRIAALTAGPAVIRILADCGHIPHREKQDTVLDSVRTFLDSAALHRDRAGVRSGRAS